MPIQDECFYVRNMACTFLRRSDGCLVISGREALELRRADAAIVAELIRLASVPLSGSELRRGASKLENGPAVLEALAKAGCLTEGRTLDALEAKSSPRLKARGQPPLGNVVFGLTGAVASAYMLPSIARLQPFARRIDVVVTRAARPFVAPAAFEAHGIQVWGSASARRGEVRVPHIELADTADLVVVCPASAHAIARLAQGACSDLVSLVVTATRAPVIVVPSMNEAMWDHPAVQRNVARIVADGVHVVEPHRGLEVAWLARGEPPRLGFGTQGLLDGAMLATLTAVAAGKPRTREVSRE
ncbi:hypothetical protein D7Y15_02240 [Corallococcus sp. AB030]|uniref:flavoprotein n=1 Tax=Corallococcus TaxID=83461 RepID=UPI000EE70743|nr:MULTISPECIES: flavoprotein [Corallococcus]NRD55773.1 hypothetical protein [Corallococcus exiguus]RKI19931.1 hypothetical protein D7Y15_02240 [Corallococcus sp. AB030]RUO89451.1 hypothetical protein D7Y11_30165 [Corallococcus sp. AB018]